MALPKKMRNQIVGESVVLTRGLEKCVYVFDQNDWQEQAEKYIESSKQDSKESKIRDLERYVYTSATEAAIDSQGRFVIPANLLEYAGLKEGTSIIGVGNRIEIWDTDTWTTHFEKLSADLAQ